MFASIKLYVMGAALAAIVLVIGLAYHHYVNLEAELATLAAEKAALSTAIAVQNNTIDSQARAVTAWQKALSSYQETVSAWSQTQQQSTEERRRLDAIFARTDLSTFSFKDPAAVEKSVNGGTLRINRMLICASGSNDPNCGSASSLTRKDNLPASTLTDIPLRR